MKQTQFLDVLSADDAHARWEARLDLTPLDGEEVALADALGRVAAVDVGAPSDVPAFDRSNVDGWAVRAEDTFGASEKDPAFLTPTGETLDAGDVPEREVTAGHTTAIATGGVLPRGADAVVMVEDSLVEDDGRVRVTRPVTPGGRISAAGSDVVGREIVVRAGTLLTARETGTLAACGLDRVHCVRRPRVAVLSTGNELVPPGTPAGPARVHDANATLVADAVRELGGEAEILGIAPDDASVLAERLRPALDVYDAVVLSGGTSKGGGDVSYRVVEELAEVVVHGVALKPGKPLCLAVHEGRPVVILPGFPASAIFTFHAFVAPVLRRRLGLGEHAARRIAARLPRAITSDVGRAEFTLANLVRGPEGWIAFPLGKGSGSVTTFARADGFFEIPANVERVDADATVDVTLISKDIEPADLVIVGSHCTGLDVVVSHLARRGITAKVISTGSMGGLAAARAGACDAAPVHLWDPESKTYNRPFADEHVRWLAGYGRRQGLALRTNDAARFGVASEPVDTADATRRAAGDPDARLANRNPGSGTFALLASTLDPDAPRPPGWHTAYRTHAAVAAAIAQGRADWGICLEQTARAAKLHWVPLADERYDFLVPTERWDGAGAVAFRAALADDDVRAALQAEGFDA